MSAKALVAAFLAAFPFALVVAVAEDEELDASESDPEFELESDMLLALGPEAAVPKLVVTVPATAFVVWVPEAEAADVDT
jgi:hypothetical protein